MKNKKSYFNSYYIRINDADFKDRIKPSAILEFFQEIATEHANSLGLDHDSMLKKNMFWVLSRAGFEIIKLPVRNETVVIETWPVAARNIDCDRDFYIRNQKGGLLVAGSTKWCIVDVNSRRPIKLPDDVIKKFEGFPDKRAVENPNPRIANVSEDTAITCSHKTAPKDIDLNMHVNNARYAEYIFNALGFDVLQNEIKTFNINYIKELKQSDVIKMRIEEKEPRRYIIEGLKEESVCFRGEVLFK
jgi:acyl-ACP thioesterase